MDYSRGMYYDRSTATPPPPPSITESGILRKVKPQQQNAATEKSFDDLLIFGYACKIFRDDEKARYIDQGKHLIPWMGDNSLKIDRYDVRGALMDISQYEPPPGGFQNRLECLSSPERKAEQLCEQERYYSLYNNDVEEEFYQEEELKRLRSQVGSEKYAQVAFSYDGSPASVANNEDSCDKPEENDETPDEVYVPHPKFMIPDGMVLPDSTKLHAIIEKTAKFIANQGPQMEILIKAKQSNNPQFEFLNLNSRLNPFYKHALQSMRDDVYPFGPPPPSPEESNSASNGSDHNTHLDSSTSAYFRPSTAYPPIQVPVMKYKPSADCAYTQLISKIKGVPLPADTDNGTSSPGSATDFDYSAYMSTHTNASSGTNTPNPLSAGTNDQPPSLVDHEKLAKSLQSVAKDGVVVKVMSTGLMLAQYYNSDSETDHDEDDADVTPTDNKKTDETVTSLTAAIAPSTTAEAVATTVDETKLGFPIPTEDLRNIIDKTAAYVLKNGKEFEEILRLKNDQRFTFLHYTDQFNSYYVYKVTGMVPAPPVKNPPTNADRANGASTSAGLAKARQIVKDLTAKKAAEAKKLELQPLSKAMTPVSFAIKAKDDLPVALRPALPQEQSDSDEEGSNTQADGGIDQPQVKQPILLPIKNVSELIREAVMQTTPAPSTFITNNISLMKNTDGGHQFLDELNDSRVRDALFEQSVTSKIEEKKEAKRADDKVRDRLAQIAREKLGILSKEKQLQIERKKRAMAFLNNIKEPQVDATPIPEPPEAADATTASNATADTPADPSSDVRLIRESSNSSSDSVTFINIIPATSARKNLRRARGNDDDGDSDVIEVTPRERRSRSRSRSRSSKHKRKHSKHSKKSKSKTKRSSRTRSRSRSSRDDRRSADRKYRRPTSSKMKKRRRRSSSD